MCFIRTHTLPAYRHTGAALNLRQVRVGDQRDVLNSANSGKIKVPGVRASDSEAITRQ